jgi:hypothetical protein
VACGKPGKVLILLGKSALCGVVWHMELAETEGFEPSIGLYNPITV